MSTGSKFPTNLLVLWQKIKLLREKARGNGPKPKTATHFEGDLKTLEKLLASSKPDMVKIGTTATKLRTNMNAYDVILSNIPTEARFSADLKQFVKVLTGIIDTCTKINTEYKEEGAQVKALLLKFTKLANLATLRENDMKAVQTKLKTCTDLATSKKLVDQIDKIYDQVGDLQHEAQELQGQMQELMT